jgi:hypothetical protein
VFKKWRLKTVPFLNGRTLIRVMTIFGFLQEGHFCLQTVKFKNAKILNCSKLDSGPPLSTAKKAKLRLGNYVQVNVGHDDFIAYIISGS